MRFPSPTRVVVMATCATFVLLGTSGATPAVAKPHHDPLTSTATPYAFRAVSYGTRVRGGDLPVSSGTTSYQAVACTNVLGTAKENQVATVELPGLGRLDGVLATAGTSGGGDDVRSYSTHDIARVSLDVPQVLGLQVKAIHASSTASHDASGYHATTDIKVGHILLTPNGLPAVELPIPKPGAPTVVPGLVSISVGKEKHLSGAAGSIAKAEGLVIQVIPTRTKIQVAHTAAKLDTGVKRGLFLGKANATQVKALGDMARSGPQPLQVVPCQGTKGEVRSKSLASVTVPGVLDVAAAGTNVMGDQSTRQANGFTQATVAHASIMGGMLVLDAIKGRAHVVRSKHRVDADTKGTGVGSAVLNGQPLSLEDLDGLEIPGVLKVETGLVTKRKAGVEVVAVRITLLDGSGAVIDLGHALLNIAGSGLRD
jgi:hypothetical protein